MVVAPPGARVHFEPLGSDPAKRAEAAAQLDHLRSLKIRLLGDQMLQRTAWDVSEELDWADTLTAEYIALAKLQADAFVTLDDALARKVEGIVPIAAFEDLTRE